jgi:hypothetical protein
MTKSSRLLLDPRQFVELYFTPSPILWAFCRTNHRFKLKKRSQLLIATSDEPLPIVPIRINDSNCSSLGINRRCVVSAR